MLKIDALFFRFHLIKSKMAHIPEVYHTEMNLTDIIAARREEVLGDYNAAVKANRRRFLEGDENATEQYIFENQIMDANAIVREFKENNCRVVSITKKTKVGMDGLMIELVKLMTTHPDDTFVVNPANVRIITGMSNAGWEKDMKDKSPNCFKDKIFHHGQLQKADIKGKNSLYIVDEIDTGNAEFSVLANTLKESGVLNVKYMEENNIRFVFASATMIKELHDLYRWGKLHTCYKMTIPSSYIGHTEFLEKNIIREFYPLNTVENAEKWVQEDIIDNYGEDFRVHIVRVTSKTVNVVQNACIKKGIIFRKHTSTDKLTTDEIKEYFKEPLKEHIVLGVKGFFRRANLIPNKWKLRIGATHELYTKIVDNNVQIQGLPGRMTGYWKSYIENGHKTGPYRTSIDAIKEYEITYNNPYGLNSYQSNGFKKVKGKVIAKPTMISPKNISGLVAVDLPVVEDTTDPKTIPIVIKVSEQEYSTFKKVENTWDDTSIFNIITKYNSHIVDEIQRIKNTAGWERDQIVEPDINAKTYTVYITNFSKAAVDKKRHYHVGNCKNKYIDRFQMYLDKTEKRVIISIYYGSKVPQVTNTLVNP